tara:strand:+ start:2398 stop:3636 length:1239 start_codon:yes stop_codon:yes gene_type:complete
MAKKQGISYSADAGLIRGEGAMRRAGGFVDAAKAIGTGFDRTSGEIAKELANREKKQAAIDAKVANSIRAMKGNVDVTGLSAADQKAVNTFLLEQKDIYAQAANLASTLKPGTPEYTEQVDIMNNVNNSFVALKENLTSYELGQTQYTDSSQDFSKGNNIGDAEFKSNVFLGNTPFRVGGGGNLLFSSPKGEVDFKDIKMPFKKNYEAALELDNMYKAVYSSGGFDESQRNSFETKLRAMAASNPDAFKSVVADGLNSYSSYGNISPDMIDDPAQQDKFIEAFIQDSLNGAQKAAADGKAAKNTNNLNDNSTSAYYAPEYTGKVDEKGNKIYNRFPKDPSGKPIVFVMEDVPVSGNGGGTPPTDPPVVVNNEFADREEEIKQALQNGIDPKQVFTDATDEEIKAVKEKYNIK